MIHQSGKYGKFLALFLFENWISESLMWPWFGSICIEQIDLCLPTVEGDFVVWSGP